MLRRPLRHIDAAYGLFAAVMSFQRRHLIRSATSAATPSLRFSSPPIFAATPMMPAAAVDAMPLITDFAISRFTSQR